MTILSKACKPNNFKSHNSLKLSFTNIRGLRSNFVDCESFLESNSSDILALCETNQNDSIDSGNFSVSGYLPLIRKDSGTHMHGLAVYVKEGLPFSWDLSLENSADSYLYFRLALLHSVPYFFFLYRLPSSGSPSSALCTVFDSISSNIEMRFSRSTHLLMFLSLKTLTSIIRTGLAILVELIDLVNSVIIFLSQITLLRWLTFLLGSQTVILIVLLFWIYFFLLTLVFVLQWLSLLCEILVVSVSIDFPTNSQRDAPFHRIAYDYSRADWNGFHDHLRDVT